MQYLLTNQNNDFAIVVGQQDALHFGTKGHSGRYPLGSGDRPYQDYPNMRGPKLSKSSGNSGKVASLPTYQNRSILQKLRDRKIKRIQRKALENVKKQEATKKAAEERQKQELVDKKHKEEVKRITTSGSISELRSIANELTYQELQTAFNRIELNEKIAKKDSPVTKVDNVMQYIKTGSDWARIGINAYNNVNDGVKIINGIVNGATNAQPNNQPNNQQNTKKKK